MYRLGVQEFLISDDDTVVAVYLIEVGETGCTVPIYIIADTDNDLRRLQKRHNDTTKLRYTTVQDYLSLIGLD